MFTDYIIKTVLLLSADVVVWLVLCMILLLSGLRRRIKALIGIVLIVLQALFAFGFIYAVGQVITIASSLIR